MAEVLIKINGKNYRMACEEGEQDRVMNLGERFNSCINDLKEKFGGIDSERLIIMAAMIITDQLYEAEQKLEDGNAEVSRLKQEGEATSEEFEKEKLGVAVKIEEAAEKIEKIAEGINQSIQSEKN